MRSSIVSAMLLLSVLLGSFSVVAQNVCVGVGTNSPVFKLDVNGSLRVKNVSFFENNVTVNGSFRVSSFLPKNYFSPMQTLVYGEVDTCNGNRNEPYNCLPGEVKECLDVSGNYKRNVYCQNQEVRTIESVENGLVLKKGFLVYRKNNARANTVDALDRFPSGFAEVTYQPCVSVVAEGYVQTWGFAEVDVGEFCADDDGCSFRVATFSLNSADSPNVFSGAIFIASSMNNRIGIIVRSDGGTRRFIKGDGSIDWHDVSAGLQWAYIGDGRRKGIHLSENDHELDTVQMGLVSLLARPNVRATYTFCD